MIGVELAIGGFYLASFCIALVAVAHDRRNAPDERVRRALRKTRRSAIRDAGQGGVAKVCGRVTCSGVPLVSPFSGRPCTYWSVTVKRLELTLIHEERGLDFQVTDDTGKAFVRVAGATVLVADAARIQRGPFVPNDPRAREFITREARSIHPHFTAFGGMTFEESVIGEGDLVAVGGPASWEPDPSPGGAAMATYREAPRRLELSTRGGVSVAIGAVE